MSWRKFTIKQIAKAELSIAPLRIIDRDDRCPAVINGLARTITTYLKNGKVVRMTFSDVAAILKKHYVEKMTAQYQTIK